MKGQIQKFTATLNQEGSTGSVRGKIPATLVTALGGQAGDVLELEVSGKTIVGGRIVRGREAQTLRSQRQYFGQQAPRAKAAPVQKPAPKPAARPTAKGNGKSVGKVALPPARGKSSAKPVGPAAKSNKNKTSVTVGKSKGKAPVGRVKPRFTI